jgi:hypothetical protein
VLRPMSSVRPLEEALPPADAHHSAPAALPSLTSRTAARSDRRVSGGVCAPRRDRRHHLTRPPEHTPATDPRHRPPAGASGAHPRSCGAERAAARRVVPEDRAGEHSHHAVCPTAGGGASSIACCDFASSHHDRWSPPRMNMWYNRSGAAGPEVVCDRGALSLTSSRTRSPCRHRQLSPMSTHVRI